MKDDMPKRGRVLRLKTGYNPNSSSLGSQIPAFLAFAAGTGAAMVAILHSLSSVANMIRQKHANDSDEENSSE